MCQYSGSKKRIAKKIHDAIIKFEQLMYGDKKLPYFEPFCGMLAVCKEFNDGRPRTVCDLNADVIKMWQAFLYKNWRPKPTITEAYYNKLRYSNVPSAERGFYGSSCGFNGSYFSTFSGRYVDIKVCIRHGYQNMLKYKPLLDNVDVLDAQSYDTFMPKNMLVYCDPPYKRTLNIHPSKNLNTFDIDKFWNIMRKWSKYNLVFISEEIAPKDFISIWKKQHTRTCNGDILKCSEHLFIHKSYFK